MTDYVNSYGPVEIIGTGSLTERFIKVRGGAWTAVAHGSPDYVVFADTLKFRMDGQSDPLDVRLLEVVIHEEMASEDGAVALTLEVKA